MNIVNDAKTVEYPKGLVYLIAKELHTQYCSKDRVAKVKAANTLRLMQYSGGVTDEMWINEVMVKKG